MTNQSKSCLGSFFLIAAIILPIFGLALGWAGWGATIGAIISISTFIFFFLAGGIILSFVEDPGWFIVWFPFIAGMAYSLLPNFIPTTIDDAAAVAAGALVTFTLVIRKMPETPRWVIIPLLVGSVYTLVGSIIPGPLDELLVGLIAIGTVSAGVAQKKLSGDTASTPKRIETQNKS